MSAWRFRQCPACDAVVPAGELLPLKYRRPHWQQQGYSLRRCPVCSHVAQTQEFRVVEDRRRERVERRG